MSDIDALKDIPGYKAIMKSVLKSQIQLLIEQLSSETGEESIILTASVHDGTLSHLGSSTGKGFLEGRDEIKSQFLGYCLKTHHHRSRLEEMNTSPYQRILPKPQSPTLQGPPKRQKILPVSLISRQPPAEFPVRPPPRPPQRHPAARSNSSEEGDLTVKQEVQDTHTNEGEQSATSGVDDSFTSTSVSLPSSLQLSHTQTSQDQSDSGQGSLNKSNRETEDSSDQTSVKIEPITENEMELEITGVELADSSVSGAESWGQGHSGYGAEGDGSFNQGADQSGYKLASMDSDKSSKIHVCQECGRQFLSRSGMSSHERSHQNKAPYKCCGKGFFSQANLKRHRCSAHGEERRFVCGVCGNKFATNADLKRHERVTHQKPAFICDVCDFASNHKQNLADHKRVHEGKKPHYCRCGKTYTYRSNLCRHKKTCKEK